MIIVVAGSGLGLLALPVSLRRFGRSLSPMKWTLLTSVALIGGSGLLLGAGLLSSMSTVMLIIGLPKLAHECDVMLGQAIPAGSPLALGITALSSSTIAL